jgi:hypothetical protein
MAGPVIRRRASVHSECSNGHTLKSEGEGCINSARFVPCAFSKRAGRRDERPTQRRVRSRPNAVVFVCYNAVEIVDRQVHIDGGGIHDVGRRVGQSI